MQRVLGISEPLMLKSVNAIQVRWFQRTVVVENSRGLDSLLEIPNLVEELRPILIPRSAFLTSTDGDIIASRQQLNVTV
jgi:hypothetical protein